MTMKRLCRDCKHLETDGMFGIFCGVGGDNTKYDCSKYEQKGVKRMNKNKGYVTANDLQKWIDHLTEEEKDLPIVVSERMFPKETEILELSSIGHFLSQHFDGFVIVAKKNYRAIIEERFEE